ncbi:hypothetical protein N0V93_000636 [Gnomoniopsis smithogilvyi]|uniref:Uncharacterized protein n=1 Tax=Gnomoniopsis smithogilvyi TaxID=1191159 RepID=A0A9W8Z4C7_9PEZI|nr:hypothetical protein N0V93_000636 [Gnomoniopsis smithogilvyi]
MTPHTDDPPVDIPPPPYSETDIYSNSAGRSPIQGQSQTLPIHQRSASHNSLNVGSVHDDASSAASNSEIIYTPPLTPHSSHSNIQPFRSPNQAGSNDGSLSPVYPNELHNSRSVASDHLSSVSAEAYFESRPVAAGVSSSRELRHGITIRPGSSPMDFPYQQEWASRDVRPDDWHTFLNYLLPHHVAESNEALIDRKLRAEGIGNNDEARSARSEKSGRISDNTSPIVAQLEQIRLEEYPNQSMNETIREWNDGFFGPRGMSIHIEQASFAAQGGLRMPGSWDQSFNTSPMPDQQAGSDGGSRWWRSLPRFETTNRGLRFGGVSIDNDRISIGDSFVADSRGLRIGGLVADDRGLSLHGRDLLGGPNPRARGQPPAPPAPPGLYNHPPMPSMPPIPPMPAIPPMPMPPDYSFPQQAAPPSFEQYDHTKTHDTRHGEIDRGPDHHGEARSHRRGRPRQGISSRHRSSSSASSSSSSSSSSSDSDISIGSLPDWDDLKDSQLAVARSYLEEWLSHPEIMVSRSSMNEAKENIKAAKQGEAAVVTRTAEREEVRKMLSQWKRVKRQQKNTRRKLRREKRALRRAAKHERRQARREARQARRESKREGRAARREAKRERRGGGSAHGRGGGCHDRGLGRGHGPSGGYSPFGGRQGFPGAGFGPGARRGGGFPFEGGRGGAFQPPAARGLWSCMERFRPRDTSGQDTNNVWPQDLPGAWPGDAGTAGHDLREDERSGLKTGVEGHEQSSESPYAVSAQMYRDLEAKRASLEGMRGQLTAFTEGQAHAETSEKGEPDEKPGASTLAGILAEMEELERAVNSLAIDADEQYARELMILEE